MVHVASVDAAELGNDDDQHGESGYCAEGWQGTGHAEAGECEGGTGAVRQGCGGCAGGVGEGQRRGHDGELEPAGGWTEHHDVAARCGVARDGYEPPDSSSRAVDSIFSDA